MRLFIEKMETPGEGAHPTREAYDLMGPSARAVLEARAERASRGQGRRFEPWEMLAEGRFALKFRPKTFTARIEGESAVVEVRGEGSEEHALVRCAREGGVWRVEPELPPLASPQAREDGGLP